MSALDYVDEYRTRLKEGDEAALVEQAERRAAAPACEHGLKPWWDCAACRASSHYGFSGNFR